MNDDSNRVDPALDAGNRRQLAGYQARHFGWSVAGKVATASVTCHRKCCAP